MYYLRALLIVLLFSLVSTSAPCEPLQAPPHTLDEALASGAESIPVIVFFRHAHSLTILGDPNAPVSDRIRALRANADESQKGFLQQFALRQTRSLRTFWLVNAVALRSDPETIKGMTQHPDVRRVKYDAMMSIPPTRVSKEAEKGTWTYGLEKLKIPEVREQHGLYGAGVTIGIIDTGIHLDHPDLLGKVSLFMDAVAGNPAPYDDQGHGTHCCGTMVGGNAGGTHIGVAPQAKLVVVKGLNSQGSGQESWLLTAMQYIADPDGNADTGDAPVVVNGSWGSREIDTCFLEATATLVSLGVFPCFAAGNSGPWSGTVGIPGGYLEAFAVGSTNSRDRVSFFSSRGPIEWDGVEHVKPDVTAPGSGIYSAAIGSGYTKMSGTSMACPHIAGVIALLYEANPGLSVAEVREILESTAKDLGSNGKDNKYGAGRVNALAAVEEALSRAR